MRLVGDGIDPDLLRKIALETGLEAGTNAEDEDAILIAITAPDEARLNAALIPPRKACIELALEMPSFPPEELPRMTGNDLFLSVRTETAANNPIAHIFIKALSVRVSLGDARQEELETAIHEAISNAILHGNLEVKAKADDFENYYNDYTAKLGNPLYGNRRVTIASRWTDDSILVLVADQGKGYKHSGSKQTEDGEAYSGRGLFLIQSLAESFELGDDGRSVEMRFRRS